MNYAINYVLLKNFERMKREITTNDIINIYTKLTRGIPLDPQIHLINELRRSFDFDQTTFPITPHILHLVITMYPNIETLKLTLKPDTKPEKFVFSCLNGLRKLQKLHLTITDGLKFFSKADLLIHELKLYFRTITNQISITRYILEKTSTLKSLTVRGGIFSLGTLKAIRLQNLKKLSLKNPTFTPCEANVFLEIINEFDLEIFKFIPIFYPETEENSICAQLTHQYLVNLPHGGLTEFAFTLLPSIFDYNYAYILVKLPLLRKLKIFIHPANDNQNLARLTPLFQQSPRELKITLTYIIIEKRNELSIQIPICYDLLNMYRNIKIEHRSNPYLAYPLLNKREHHVSITKFRQTEFERKYNEKQKNSDITSEQDSSTSMERILPTNDISDILVSTSTEDQNPSTSNESNTELKYSIDMILNYPSPNQDLI